MFNLIKKEEVMTKTKQVWLVIEKTSYGENNDTFSIAKTKNNSISIINCEHEYWKTEQNYKEYIINNEFFQEWQQ